MRRAFGILIFSGLLALLLIEEPDAQNSVSADTQRASWKFSPVFSFHLGSAQTNRFLDLYDGKSYANLRTNSAVCYLQRDPKRGWALVIDQAFNYHTGRESGRQWWLDRTAEEVAQPAGLAAVPFERTGIYLLEREELPTTILLPAFGLLRVTAFETNKLGEASAKLEFKKVLRAENGVRK